MMHFSDSGMMMACPTIGGWGVGFGVLSLILMVGIDVLVILLIIWLIKKIQHEGKKR